VYHTLLATLPMRADKAVNNDRWTWILVRRDDVCLQVINFAFRTGSGIRRVGQRGRSTTATPKRRRIEVVAAEESVYEVLLKYLL